MAHLLGSPWIGVRSYFGLRTMHERMSVRRALIQQDLQICFAEDYYPSRYLIDISVDRLISDVLTTDDRNEHAMNWASELHGCGTACFERTQDHDQFRVLKGRQSAPVKLFDWQGESPCMALI